MVDYRKASTSSTDLVIRDESGQVSFWLDVSSASTWFGSARSWSGRVNGVNVGGGYTWASGGGMRRIAGPWVVSSTQDVTFAIGDSGTAGIGGPVSFTQRITRAVPVAPSNVTVKRVSDSQQTLEWSRPSVYTSVVVQRTSSAGSWTGWQQVGVAAGNAYTFTDKTTAPNRAYAYRVAGVNAAGQSAWSAQSAIVYTTPAVPTGVRAERSAGNVVVSASGVPPYAAGFDVRDGSTVIASGVSLPYTHVAPSATVPHTYTARAVRSTPHVLASAWSSPSNTVQLVSPPNAPTGLVPNGSVVPSDTDVLFKWKHNAVDSSPQSAFELRYRVDGGAWVTVSGTTVSQVSRTLDVASVEWQVRTKGQHPDWSPWSAVAAFAIVDRPGVAVVQPSGVWDSAILVVGWTWFQAQGRPQSAWRVQLLDDAGNVVESRNGSGPSAGLQLNRRLTEGVWTVQVQGATGDLWSLVASETFTVAFDPPSAPILSGEWDESQGGAQLTVASEEFVGAVPDGDAWFVDLSS